MYDTPGTLYPNIEDQNVAKKLAYVGSVRDEVLDFVELANELLTLLEKIYPQNISERYKSAKTLEEIAKMRNYVLSGGEYDIERTAKGIIDDFRKGRLGKICLD